MGHFINERFVNGHLVDRRFVDRHLVDRRFIDRKFGRKNVPLAFGRQTFCRMDVWSKIVDSYIIGCRIDLVVV